MMEAVSTSEMSVNFYDIARGNMPEDSHLHTRHLENLKFCLVNTHRPDDGGSKHL
jgi:hypothetical protein